MDDLSRWHKVSEVRLYALYSETLCLLSVLFAGTYDDKEVQRKIEKLIKTHKVRMALSYSHETPHKIKTQPLKPTVLVIQLWRGFCHEFCGSKSVLGLVNIKAL